jgi:UV DNA damage endonuclease
MTLKSAHERGLGAIIEMSKKNAADLLTILKWNEAHGIRFFRITSNLIPHCENPKLQLEIKKKTITEDGISVSVADISFLDSELEQVGAYARAHGHRLTFHPGQYAQLASPDQRIVAQTVQDLAIHAQIFIKMGMTPSDGSVMIIHGGGTFGDIREASKRWISNFRTLPKWISQYVAVENDEHQYSVLDLLPICEELNIPLCPDFFHHSVKHAREFDIMDWKVLGRIVETWKRRGITGKCHLSEQRPGERRGAHSDCITSIPNHILDFAKRHNFDIMLEVKHKDKCLLSVLKKQFIYVNNMWVVA